MNRIVKALCIMMTSIHCHGQEQVVALNHYLPAMYQPAWSVLDHDATLAAVTRNTAITADIRYKSHFFVAEFPVVDVRSGRRLFGTSVYASGKDAGSTDLLKAFQAGVSLAYDLPVDKDHSLAFGLQSVFSHKRTSLENLTTGSQWLASEFRFDPDADLGEHIIQNRIQHVSINAGAIWNWRDHVTRKQNAIVSFSAYDLNRPNDSFLKGESKVQVSYLLMASASIYQTRKYELWPSVFYHRTALSEFRVQLTGKCRFKNDNPYDILQTGTVDLVSQFDFQNNLSVGLHINQPNLSIGFNYTFNVAIASATQPFRNATEYGIRVLKTLWKPKPSTIVINNTSIGTKRNIVLSPSRNQTTVVEQPSDADVIQSNIGTLAKVNSVRFELDKDFKFAFGKTELSAEAKLYLDELVALLNNNQEYKIEIVGHTDNVGKPIVNYKLSAARAQAVAQYMMRKGISGERIKHAGRGDTEPLAPNDSEPNRARNRRVHFVIYVNR